jgi:hypothetical protein
MVRIPFTGAALRCLAVSALALLLCWSPAAADDVNSLRQTPIAYESAYQSTTTSYLDSAPEAPKAAATQEAAVGEGNGDYGQCCPPRRFFYADIEATFLAPDFDHQSLAIVGVDLVGDRIATFNPGASVEDNMYVGPRITLGVQGECWGLAGRFWKLSDSATSSDFGTWYDTSTFQRFNAFTTDLEITRQFCRGCWAGQVAFGVRHAELDFDSCLRADRVFDFVPLEDDPFVSGMAGASNQFQGTGLTFALLAKRPITSKAYLFCGLRGSVLWGEAVNTVSGSAMLATPDDLAFGSGEVAVGCDKTMFIGEVQVGLQYECPLRCVPANAFFRVAFEYQNWSVDSPYLEGVAVAEVDDVIGVAAGSISGDADMQLVGFNLGAGLTW